ncbi:MAG: TetR/AcrR family transcriptional regulator [Phenylobacterium sp.]|uniref:TetR/AcrR family transcriptional regulator n=1 Tax=Phenylobacterium sp. TaxID=1871053 RepID=UPI00391B6931
MRETAAAGPRPYHHGDLRRALIDAARRLLESEGPTALSLRAVAREAGVSPAAPYHHFKDKSELLDAVAAEGWELLNEKMTAARTAESSLSGKLASLGVAYVRFARDNPALYRVMYDASRDKEGLPEHVHQDEDSAYCQVRNTLVEAGVDPLDDVDLELATTAAWAAAHGLAEMVAFKQFQPLKDALGGEDAFLRGVFEHLGVFALSRRG